MDRISHLRVFVQLAETLNFGETASILQISRSSVSKIVQGLETDLCTRLIYRTTRKVVLTHDGTVFYRHCLSLVRDADIMIKMFEQQIACPKGKLRVNVPGKIGRLIIAPRLPEFFKIYPDIELELAVVDRSYAQKLVTAVIRRRFELA